MLSSSTSTSSTSTSTRIRTADVISSSSSSSSSPDFSSLFLSEPILAGLTTHGYSTPSPIQTQVIPLGRCGLDVITQAKSGTGKTIVFAVVALEALRVALRAPQALVLAPTREIAVQICDVIRQIGDHVAGLTCEVFIGGLHVAQDVAKGTGCQVVVGTPGWFLFCWIFYFSGPNYCKGYPAGAPATPLVWPSLAPVA